jgi:hypothetical protein
MPSQQTSYAATLADAQAELAALRADRAALDNRIRNLEQTIRSLGSLLGQETPEPRVGLTAGIKHALKLVEGSGLYPTTVKARLQQAGVPLPANNPMASIHTVLKRLAADGYAEARIIDGKRAYFWVSDKPRGR